MAALLDHFRHIQRKAATALNLAADFRAAASALSYSTSVRRHES